MQLLSMFSFSFDRNRKAKLPYYVCGVFRMLMPKWLFQRGLVEALKSVGKRADKDYIQQRVDYYNKLVETTRLPIDSPRLNEHTYGNNKSSSVYFFDTYEFTRWFDQQYQWRFKGGDITELFPAPTVTKSRPISDENSNSVLLNLDKVRHFNFVNDKTPFEDKQPVAQFAGWVWNNTKRKSLFEKWFGHPKLLLRDSQGSRPEWASKKVSIAEQMQYRYILAIEGNDVATCLKWVMSSNSIAVMPRPEYETWFMEGTLIPDYHYIEVEKDYSNLIDKLEYYDAHIDEAKLIIAHAHEYVEQFQDAEREKLISLMVMDKYFKMTGQQ